MMGRRGWAGSPPADDEEARKRIVDAAVRSVETRGAASSSVSQIAADLGITRVTVYRYFADAGELFTAVGEVAVERWIARLEHAVDGLDDMQTLLIETMAFILEEFPRDELLSVLLTTGHVAVFSEQILGRRGLDAARGILLARKVDWAGLGYDDAALDELVEYLVRVLHSMILVPPEPPRTGQELRNYLRRWVGPALIPRRA